MKNIFLSGILSYIIFQFFFYFLSGLANAALIHFDIGEYLYIALLVLSGGISLLLLMYLFKHLTKGKMNSKSILQLIGLLIIVSLLYFGVNRYIGFLAENQQNISLGKLGYFAYPTFVFAITAVIGVLFIYMKKEIM